MSREIYNSTKITQNKLVELATKLINGCGIKVGDKVTLKADKIGPMLTVTKVFVNTERDSGSSGLTVMYTTVNAVYFNKSTQSYVTCSFPAECFNVWE